MGASATNETSIPLVKVFTMSFLKGSVKTSPAPSPIRKVAVTAIESMTVIEAQLQVLPNGRFPPIAVIRHTCETARMLRAYHHRTVERANAAVASGRITTIYAAMAAAAIVWAIPALLAVVICVALGLKGTDSLLVSVPLVAASIAGGCIYVGWVYGRAIQRRR
jgi:mannose/fructose/N-acetylgalactosamine-specific phosphotransferase system component IIC